MMPFLASSFEYIIYLNVLKRCNAKGIVKKPYCRLARFSQEVSETFAKYTEQKM